MNYQLLLSVHILLTHVMFAFSPAVIHLSVLFFINHVKIDIHEICASPMQGKFAVSSHCLVLHTVVLSKFVNTVCIGGNHLHLVGIWSLSGEP